MQTPIITNKQRQSKPELQTNNNEVVVSAKNVSKKFCKNLRRGMAYGIADLSKNLIGVKPDSTGLRKDEFWAVEDISFELRRGEILGIIGVNGAGKSTILRLLSGIFPPDKGEISIKGRIGALIAVGAGFHPHMTGRENIYLNGTILGMSRSEIRSKFQDIVEFSEIGDFLDAPVSTYSSGMRVRLGFSIAAYIEPDVMLIDEVLAVGDIGFRVKCFNIMDRVFKKSAVIFISHQMPYVAKISSKIIVLNQGKVVYQGKNVHEGISYYHSQFESATSSISGSGRASIDGIRLYLDGHEASEDGLVKIHYLDDLYIDVAFTLAPEIEGAVINVAFYDKEMRGGAEIYSDSCNFKILNKGRPIKTRLKIPKLPLNPGTYSITITLFDLKHRETLLRLHAFKDIQILGSFLGFSSVQLQGEWKFV